MCSGCSTCGNRTRFGSGNKRTLPENFDSSKSSAGIMDMDRLLTLARGQRLVGGGFEMNLGNQLGIDFDAGEFFGGGGDQFEAAIHLGDKLVDIESFEPGPK